MSVTKIFERYEREEPVVSSVQKLDRIEVSWTYEVEKSMTFTATGYKHIELNEDKVPILAGTTMKVVELVTSHIVYGWSPEELHFQYPHIGLSKIYSALAYYWDYKEEIESDMQRRLELAERFRQKADPSPIVEKLRAKGLL